MAASNQHGVAASQHQPWRSSAVAASSGSELPRVARLVAAKRHQHGGGGV